MSGAEVGALYVSVCVWGGGGRGSYVVVGLLTRGQP